MRQKILDDNWIVDGISPERPEFLSNAQIRSKRQIKEFFRPFFHSNDDRNRKERWMENKQQNRDRRSHKQLLWGRDSLDAVVVFGVNLLQLGLSKRIKRKDVKDKTKP